MANATDFERLTRIVVAVFKRVHESFEIIDGRFDAVHIRFDQIEKRLEGLDGRITNGHVLGSRSR
jgi:hypothetical protein